MCAECAEFDKMIARYREIKKQGFDPLTTERMAQAIIELEARKLALHEGPV